MYDRLSLSLSLSIGSGSFHASSQLVLADAADDGKSIVKARPHSQWGHNLGSSGRAVSPLASRPSTSFVPTVAYASDGGSVTVSGNGRNISRTQASGSVRAS